MRSTLLHLLASVGAFGLAVLLMRGTVQEYIDFADPINEMAMCVVAMMMGTASMFVVVEDIRKWFKK
ncbi:MAG: hypothetical protein O3C07_02300 [Bacteroidetes bacterium]|nr:hypothetical protein [Bacteroidota bacterium]